jgi:hypothetical protein
VIKVARWLDVLHQEAQSRAYILRLDILDHSQSMLKARLYISPDLFVQVYRNDRYDTTNLAVLYGGRRIYGRDQLGGRWHRHRAEAPDVHDTSTDESRPVELAEFLDEAEEVLAAMGLP